MFKLVFRVLKSKVILFVWFLRYFNPGLYLGFWRFDSRQMILFQIFFESFGLDFGTFIAIDVLLSTQLSHPENAKKSCTKLFVKLHWNSKTSKIPRFLLFSLFSSPRADCCVEQPWKSQSQLSIPSLTHGSWLSSKECTGLNKVVITCVISYFSPNVLLQIQGCQFDFT